MALSDMVAYAETSVSKEIILIILGRFDNETGEGGQMDDNMRFPKEIRSKK